MTNRDKALARLLMARLRWSKVNVDGTYWVLDEWREVYDEYRDAQYDFIRAHQGTVSVNLMGLDLQSAVKRCLNE